MARRLRAALGLILLATSGLHASATSNLYVRFFGPIATGCSVTQTGVTGTAVKTADDATAGPGYVSAAAGATQITVTSDGTASCIDTMTGANFPFSLGGYAATTATQVNAVGNVAEVVTGHTAAAAYDTIGNLIQASSPGAKQIADFTPWATSSVYATIAAGATATQKDGKKVLVADLQFIALVVFASLENTALTGGCASIDLVAAKVAAALNAAHTADGTKPDLTVAADVLSLLQTALGNGGAGCGCDASSLTTSSPAVLAINTLATYASTLGNTADASFSLRDIAHMAGLATYLSGTRTLSEFSSWASGTLSADLATAVHNAMGTNMNAATILATLNAMNLQDTTQTPAADITIGTWDTTVYATNAGPLYGASMTYTPFNRLTYSAATTDAVTASKLVTGATLGVYTIPAAAKDYLLKADGTIRTSVPINGLAPLPPQSLKAGNTYSIYMGPGNALVYATYKAAQATAVTLPVPADWKTAYEKVTGTLPAGNYLTRVLDTGAQYQGSYAAFAVFIADTMLSSTVNLAGLFLKNSDAQANYAAGDISDLLFAQLVGKSATDLGTANTIRDAMISVYNTITAGSITSSDTKGTKIATMAAAVAAVNTLAASYLPADNTIAITKGRPTPANWLAVAKLANYALGTMAPVFGTYGTNFQTFVGNSGDTTFSSGVAAAVTTPYVTNLATNVAAVSTVNQDILNTVMVANWDTTVYAMNIGPISGAALTYQTFLQSTGAATASTDAKTGGVLVPGATWGYYTIPAGSKDMMLSTDGSVTTSIATTGVAPFPPQSSLAAGATYSVYLGPINALVYATYTASGTEIVPVASDWKSAYEAILGASSLPTGDYSTRTLSGVEYQGSDAAFGVYIADIIISNTATLTSVFLDGACTKKAGKATADIVTGIFNELVGKSGADLTTDGTKIQTAMYNVYNAICSATISSPSTEYTALGTMATAIAAVNNVAWGYKPADLKTTSTLGERQTSDKWVAVTNVARLGQKDMVADFIKFAGYFKTALATTFANNVAASITTPYTTPTLTAADTGTLAKVTGINMATLATVHAPVEGFARFFGPLSAGCSVTYGSDSTGMPATTLGKTLLVGTTAAYAQVTISTTSCTDAFTGAAIPYPVVSYGNFKFQASSTTTIGSQDTTKTAADSYAKLGLAGTAGASGGLDSTTWTQDPYWEEKSVFDNMAAGYSTLGKRLLAYDLKFIAVSVGFLKAASTYTFGTNCGTPAKLQLALAKAVAAQGTAPDLTKTADLTTLFTNVQGTCTKAEMPDATLTAITTSDNLAAIVALVKMADTLANAGDNTWVLNDLAAMAHYAAYLQGTIDLPTIKGATSAALTASIGNSTIAGDQVAKALVGTTYSAKDTTLVVFATGPVSGAQLKYQPFSAMSSSALVDATNAALITDSTGAVTVPGATHGVYTLSAGALDMFLSTTTENVTTSVPLWGATSFPSTDATIKKDTVYFSPGTGLVWSNHKYTQNLATYLTGTATKPAAPSASEWQTLYQTMLGATNLPSGDYQARSQLTLADGKTTAPYAGSLAALGVFAVDLMANNILTLGGVYINNVLAASATNSIDLIVSSLYDQLAATATPATITTMADATAVDGYLTAAFTAANAKTAPGTKDTSALQLIANAIANVNTKVKADILASVTGAASTDARAATADATKWLEAVQIAKLVNFKMVADVKAAAATVKAATSMDTATTSSVTASVITPYSSTTLDKAVTASTLNLTAVANVVGPLKGYARFFGPLSDGCPVTFGSTTQSQWTKDGSVIAILQETVAVNQTCMDTFTGKMLPYPVSGWAPASTGAGASFQISSTTTIAANTGSASTAHASYKQLGLADTATAGVDAGAWTGTSTAQWEYNSVWANLQGNNAVAAKRLLALDLQFMALSVGAAAAIKAADTTGALKTGCQTVADLQAALAGYASKTTVAMAKNSDISTVIGGIQSACSSKGFSTTLLTATTTDANLGGILTHTAMAAKLANTANNNWVLNDVCNMARFTSYIQGGVSLSSDATALRAAVVASSIDVGAITKTLGIKDYATSGIKDTVITVLGLGPLNGTVLSYQPFWSMDAANLDTATDESGMVEVANATHALYTIPAGMTDAFLTNDTTSPVRTLVPWTSVAPFTGPTGKIVVNPTAALLYAQMRAAGQLTVPTAAAWKTAYEKLMGAGVSLPASDYQARSDPTLLGSYASLAMLAADVIVQSTPTLGGLFIYNSLQKNGVLLGDVVYSVFDAVQASSAGDLSTAATVGAAITTAWTNVAGGTAPTTSQATVITSVATAIAASNALAKAVIDAAVPKFSTIAQQDFATWKSVVQVAKVQNDMATPIVAIAKAIFANSTTVTTDVVTQVQTPYTSTNLTAAVAAAAVNDDAVRHAAGLGRTANARFFGPLSAGCAVSYATTKNTSTTQLGMVAATAMEQLTVTKCQDTFTGMAAPFDVIGYALDQFQLSATTSIGAEHSGSKTAQFAYGQLGITTDDVPYADWFKNRKLESANIFELLAMGDITVPKMLLQKDLGFLALSAGIVSAITAADTTGSLKTGCKSPSELQQALAAYVASLADGAKPAVLDLSATTPATAVSAAITGVQAVCTAASAAIPTAVLSAAGSTANVAAITALVNAAFAEEDNNEWPLQQVASFAHLASYASGALALSGADFKTADSLAAAIDATSINADAICSSLGVEGYVAKDMDFVPSFTGPLTGVNATYQAFTQILAEPLTDAAGLIHVAGATHGVWMLGAGATIQFLTTDATKPVKTLVPVLAITGFPGANSRMVVGPMNYLVLSKFTQGDGTPVAVPDPSMWKDAYETLIGAALPPNDYHTRNYTKDSATGLAVFAIDMVLPALPTLGGLLIEAALPQAAVDLGMDINMVLHGLFAGVAESSLKDLSDVQKVTDILLEVYTTLTGVEVTTNSTARRVLLDTGATMSAILSNIGAALADSNAMAGNVLNTAMAAIANGTAVDPSLFTQLVKIASVQNVNLAAAVQDIASKIAAGQLDAALNASAVAKDAYTGTNLMAAVAAAKVNDAAISAALLPDPGTPGAATTSSSSSSSSSSKTLAIGLGVGLGVGIPLVVGIGAAVFMSIKKRRAMQTTTPAPPA